MARRPYPRSPKLDAIQPQPAEAAASKPAFVYDATGVMLAAINPRLSATAAVLAPAFVYDATGAMLAAIGPRPAQAAAVAAPAFIYDATGAMLAAVPGLHGGGP